MNKLNLYKKKILYYEQTNLDPETKIYKLNKYKYKTSQTNQNNQNNQVGGFSLPNEFANDLSKPIIESSNQFTFNLLATIKPSENDPNICISGFSIFNILGIVFNGLEGQTLKELCSALNVNKEVFSTGMFAKLNRYLSSSSSDGDSDSYEMAISNNAYINTNFCLEPKYISDVEINFGVKPEIMDVSKPEKVAEKINAMIGEVTHNKITDVVQPDMITFDTIMILVNAIYFNGLWDIPFDIKHTKETTFNNYDGTSTKISSMSLYGKYFYYVEKDNYEAIQLEYKTTTIARPVLLIVKLKNFDNTNCDEFDSLLDELQNIKFYNKEKINLQIPKFKMEYSTELRSNMETLGIKKLFKSSRDFNLISNREMKVDGIIQKTFLEIDEKGTEAAAVTVFMMKTSSLRRETKPRPFIVDSPFYLLLKDQTTGLILFAAIIKNFCE